MNLEFDPSSPKLLTIACGDQTVGDLELRWKDWIFVPNCYDRSMYVTEWMAGQIYRKLRELNHSDENDERAVRGLPPKAAEALPGPFPSEDGIPPF